MPNIAKNLEKIRESIRQAETRAGRVQGSVQLIAVSKGVTADQILEAYNQGQRDFGESRLQEAIPKIETLPKDIRWHFIGDLQSNKVKRIADSFSVIHSLDRSTQIPPLQKIERSIDALIEVNIGNEIQKSGISPDALDEFVESVLKCKHVRLRGLMTIGPVHQNPELARPYFQQLKKLADRFGPDAWLSMGMSSDFEVAIQEGSTHVRVGSAIFKA